MAHEEGGHAEATECPGRWIRNAGIPRVEHGTYYNHRWRENECIGDFFFVAVVYVRQSYGVRCTFLYIVHVLTIRYKKSIDNFSFSFFLRECNAANVASSTLR